MDTVWEFYDAVRKTIGDLKQGGHAADAAMLQEASERGSLGSEIVGEIGMALWDLKRHGGYDHELQQQFESELEFVQKIWPGFSGRRR